VFSLSFITSVIKDEDLDVVVLELIGNDDLDGFDSCMVIDRHFDLLLYSDGGEYMKTLNDIVVFDFNCYYMVFIRYDYRLGCNDMGVLRG